MCVSTQTQGESVRPGTQAEKFGRDPAGTRSSGQS